VCDEGGDQRASVVQMSFGGHHAKEASDQLQKKLQEAMADVADKLAAGMAGMDVKDPVQDPVQDDTSMGSANAMMELELLRMQNRHLQSQMNVMTMTTASLSQQLAETTAAVSPEQLKHNNIISNPVFVNAISAMPELDIDTLWWMVQWGNEYLAKFKRDATHSQKKAHDNYKKWTQMTKQKQLANFTASLRSGAGDDSLNQSFE
jgi:hypothetical protein